MGSRASANGPFSISTNATRGTCAPLSLPLPSSLFAAKKGSRESRDDSPTLHGILPNFLLYFPISMQSNQTK